MSINRSYPQETDLPRLSAPAHRALAGASIHTLGQLAQYSEDEIKQMHGIGPTTLVQLRSALKAKGLSFASKQKITR